MNNSTRQLTSNHFWQQGARMLTWAFKICLLPTLQLIHSATSRPCLTTFPDSGVADSGQLSPSASGALWRFAALPTCSTAYLIRLQTAKDAFAYPPILVRHGFLSSLSSFPGLDLSQPPVLVLVTFDHHLPSLIHSLPVLSRNIHTRTAMAGDSNSSPQSAFVTGATGFIGAHVCSELLKAGWTVRAAARTEVKAKGLVDALLKLHPDAKDKLSTVIVPDMCVESAYDDSVKGECPFDRISRQSD